MRTYHEQRLTKRSYGFDGQLTVLGCVADVLRFGADDFRETLEETVHDIFGLVERKRGLSKIDDALGILDIQAIHVCNIRDERCIFRRFTERADHLIMILVADQNDGVTLPGELLGFQMDLGDQRTGRVDDFQAALARLGHVSRARISQILNLLYLAPDIQEQILFLPATERGRDLLHLDQLQALTRILDWQRQRAWWRAVNDRLTIRSPVGRRLSSPKRSENLS